jgi:hypothetical protein
MYVIVLKKCKKFIIYIKEVDRYVYFIQNTGAF